MRRHLLVTNDFPPKIGGIQAYLWELWRRLPPEDVTVLTTPHPEAAAFDAEQAFRVVRSREPWLLPHPLMVRRVRDLAAEVGAELVVFDPAVPIGGVGPQLGSPYAVVVHGAEVTVPGRLPVSRSALGAVLRGAELVIAAGGYPAAEAEHAAGRQLPTVVIPPGIDIARFVPLDESERRAARRRFDLPVDAPLVHAGSRLVPRKGIDLVLRAADRLVVEHPDLHVVVSGDGRDRRRLELIAASGRVPVRFLGRVPDADLPALYACADVFAMVCRTRWGGLEQEGFGIVFLEAAACGVPQIAGRSGGSHEAVDDGVSGVVVDPDDPSELRSALRSLLGDPTRRTALGRGARQRAEAGSYDVLARRLEEALS